MRPIVPLRTRTTALGIFQDVFPPNFTFKLFTEQELRKINAALSQILDHQLTESLDFPSFKPLFHSFSSFLKQSSAFPIKETIFILRFLTIPSLDRKFFRSDQLLEITSASFTYFQSLNPQKNADLLLFLRYFKSISSRIALNESIIGNILPLAFNGFFNSLSTPPLQTASCLFICHIFEINKGRRGEIINEICVRSKKENPKGRVLNFPNSIKHKISGFSRLIFEILQVVELKELDQLCQMILGQISSDNQLFRCFFDDVCVSLVYPLFPVSHLILNWILSLVFSKLNARFFPKIACDGLNSIFTLIQKTKSEVGILVPIGFAENLKIPDEMKEGNDILLKLSSEFPSTSTEKILLQILICAYLNQTKSFSEIGGDPLSFYLKMWESSAKDETEKKILNHWKRGYSPDPVIFEWTNEIAHFLVLFHLKSSSLFVGFPKLLQHLLSSLDSASVTSSTVILKGFSTIVEKDPSFLHNPILVSQMSNMIFSPSPSIREAVLTIVASHISKVDQFSSQYFPVIVKSVQDPSPIVVRQALSALKSLSRSVDDESSVFQLASILASKLDNSNPVIANLSREVFIEILSISPQFAARLLNSVVSLTPNLSDFIRFYYENHSEFVKQIIAEISSDILDKVHLFVLFCETIPSFCVSFADEILLLLTEVNSDKFSLLADAFSPLVQFIVTPNIQSLNAFFQKIRLFIGQGQTAAIRSVIRLSAEITTHLLPNDSTLSEIFDFFFDFLKKEDISNSAKVLRSVFICGCIGRYSSNVDRESLFSLFQRYLQSDKIANPGFILNAISDICVASPELNQLAQPILVESLSGSIIMQKASIHFLCNLIHSESNSPNYSTNFVQTLFPKILEISFQNPNELFHSVLAFIQLVLSESLVSPRTLFPFVIASFSFSSDPISVQIIKNAPPGIIEPSFSEGLLIAYSHINPLESGFCSLFFIDYLESKLKSDVYLTIGKMIQEEVLNQSDSVFFTWIIQSLANVSFQPGNEMYPMLDVLFSKNLSLAIQSIFHEAKKSPNILLCYNVALFLHFRTWLGNKLNFSSSKDRPAILKPQSNVPTFSFSSFGLPSILLSPDEIKDDVLKCFFQAKCFVKK